MFTRRTLATIAGVGTILLSVTGAQAAVSPGAVFVMTNDAEENEVISYDRAADGRLTDPERYSTEGRGSGGITDPLTSQGSLTLSDDHSLLFAVNAGSGTVSMFRIRKRSLQLTDKAPTGGSAPVAVAQRGDLVFVLNAAGRGNVVGFRIDLSGRLRRIKNSNAFLTANFSGGASLAISPNGQYLTVTERVPNNVDTFRINADGTLGPVVVNASAGPGAFSATFAPSGTIIVSETGAPGTVRASAVSSYSVLPSGTLSVITRSLATFGDANCWNVVTPNGKFVYVSNSASSSISGFAIGAGGTLTPVAGTVLATSPAGVTNLDMAVSADGMNLYTLNSGSGAVGAFSIQPDGTLIGLGEFGMLPKAAGFNGIAAY